MPGSGFSWRVEPASVNQLASCLHSLRCFAIAYQFQTQVTVHLGKDKPEECRPKISYGATELENNLIELFLHSACNRGAARTGDGWVAGKRVQSSATC